MRHLTAFLTVAAAATVLGSQPAAAAQPRAAGHMVLQYAAQPDAGKKTRARLLRRTSALGLEVRTFRKLPMLLVEGSPARLRRAARLPGVRAAHRADRRLRFLLDRSVPLVYGGSPQAAWAAGHDGSGQTIAIVDTGIDGTHPDLLDRVKHNVEFAFDAEEFAFGIGDFAPVAASAVCPGPCNTDTFGHGTHVAGVAAGAGAIPVDAVKGVAPGADLVGLSISQSGTTLEFYALAAFDYILAHPELSIDVVNNSWFIPAEVFDPTDPVNVATKLLHDRGIAVVFAAGNSSWSTGGDRQGRPEGSSDCTEGGDCKITIQSVAPWTISVAAGARVFDGGLPAQRLADFSSRGDAIPHTVEGGMEIRYWPTITAPGTGIIGTSSPTTAMNPATCSLIGDIPRCLDRTAIQNVFYTAPNGTSMAAPHVAGAIAAIQSAAQDELGRQLTPDEVKALIERSASPMQGVDGSYDFCRWPIPPFDEIECGLDANGATQQPYAPWQVGAGYLDVGSALAGVPALADPAVE